MPELRIRDLDAGPFTWLRMRGQRHDRSLYCEARKILQTAPLLSMSKAGERAAGWHRKLIGGAYCHGPETIRANRER